MKQNEELKACPYGFCPNCGEMGQSRERRPNGNDTCIKGCVYPSRNAISHQPEQPSWDMPEEIFIKPDMVDMNIADVMPCWYGDVVPPESVKYIPADLSQPKGDVDIAHLSLRKINDALKELCDFPHEHEARKKIINDVLVAIQNTTEKDRRIKELEDRLEIDEWGLDKIHQLTEHLEESQYRLNEKDRVMDLLERSLAYVLPMAKAHTHKHDVGGNKGKIEHAEQALAQYEKLGGE